MEPAEVIDQPIEVDSSQTHSPDPEPAQEPTESEASERGKLTPVERETDLALSRHHGNRSMACHELLIKPELLKSRIKMSAYLKEKWGFGLFNKVKEKAGAHLKAVQENQKTAYEREVVKLGEMLQDFNLTPDEQILARTAARFNHEFFFHSMDIVSGAVAREVVKMHRCIDKFHKRLDEVEARLMLAQTVEERERGIAEEKHVVDCICRLAENTRRTFEAQQATNVLMANIRLRLLGRQSTVQPTIKRVKPGFSAANMSNQSNGNGF